MKPAEPEFLQQMLPWSSLSKFSNSIKIKDNLNLFYFESGESHTNSLILVHGLGDEADTWRHVFTPLATHYHVFAIDLPGFGRSDKPKVDYSPSFMMSTIIRFIDQLELDNPILMGSSLGGMLSHGIAITYPEKIKGLILVGGALLQPNPTQDLSLRLMQMPLIGEWLYTRLRKNPKAAFDSLKNVYYQLASLPKADQDFLFTRVNQRVWSDDQRRAYFSILRNMFPWVKEIQRLLPQELSQLILPTLVMRGDFDILYSQENAEQLANIQPNTTLTTIKNTGHLPHQEDPEGFLDAVTSWLITNR